MNFRTFLKLFKCKALGDFLISFSEITIPKGCLGGINQNSIFRNWFEILDIFWHWLLTVELKRPLKVKIDEVGLLLRHLYGYNSVCFLKPVTSLGGAVSIFRESKISNEKSIFFLILPRHPFLRTSFQKNILKFQGWNLKNVWKFVKKAVFALPKRSNRRATLGRCWQR